jgi:CheY-like chemotaxis protein
MLWTSSDWFCEERAQFYKGDFVLEQIQTSGFTHSMIPDYRTSCRGRMIRSKRILIVDDIVDVRLSLADILINYGFKVATAKNGLDGLNYLSRNYLPDLILLDLSMPVMDGYDLMEKIRSHSDLRKIPVIIISGEVDEVRIKELAMDKLELLEKPLDHKMFVDLVEKAIF